MTTFSCKASSSQEWKAITGAIKQLVEVANFSVTPEGLSLVTMDSGPFRMIEVNWPKAGFETFECENPFTFSVRTEDFAKFFARSKPQDTVTLSQDQSLQEGMKVALQATGFQPREFVMHLVEKTKMTDRRLKIDFKSKIVINREDLQSILEDAELVAGNVAIACTQGGLTFNASDPAMGSYSYTVMNGESTLVDFKPGPEKAEGVYNLERLLGMVKLTELRFAETVFLQITPGPKPINLVFELNKGGASMSYYTTPQI